MFLLKLRYMSLSILVSSYVCPVVLGGGFMLMYGKTNTIL